MGCTASRDEYARRTRRDTPELPAIPYTIIPNSITTTVLIANERGRIGFNIYKIAFFVVRAAWVLRKVEFDADLAKRWSHRTTVHFAVGVGKCVGR